MGRKFNLFSVRSWLLLASLLAGGCAANRNARDARPPSELARADSVTIPPAPAPDNACQPSVCARLDRAGQERIVNACAKRCDADPGSCVDLGGIHYWGACGISAHGKRGIELYLKACRAGNADACLLADAKRACDPYGCSKSDPAGKSRTLAQCEHLCQTDARFCSGLASAYERGFCGVPRDPERAVQFNERACLAGNGFDCVQAASALLYLGRPADIARAIKLYGPECRENGDADCALLIELLRKPSPLRDPARALQLLLTGCGGDGYKAWESCDDAAGMLEKGEEVPADEPRAARLRTRSHEIHPHFPESE